MNNFLLFKFLRNSAASFWLYKSKTQARALLLQPVLAAKAIRTTPTTPSRAICSQRFLARVVTCISMCITSLNYLNFCCRSDVDQMDSVAVLHGSHHWLELFAGAITPLMSDTSDV